MNKRAGPVWKGCFLVFDPGVVEHRLLERFRDLSNAHEFAEKKTAELGRQCIVRDASVGSDVKLVDEA